MIRRKLGGRNSNRPLSLLFREIIRIDPLQLIRRTGRHPNLEVEHVLRELLAINQDHAGIDMRDVLDGVSREAPGRQKLARPPAMQRAHKALNLGAPDRSLPALGLNVDSIEAQPVLTNHAIEPLVAGATNRSASLGTAPPIPHLEQQLDDEPLEKLGELALTRASSSVASSVRMVW